MSQIIASRLAAIRTEMAKSDLDAFIIPREDEYLGEYVPEHNERLLWASGFTGSAGAVVVLKDSAAIFVDGRYTVQVRQQVDAQQFEYFDLIPLAPWLADKLSANARIGFDSRLHTLTWYNQSKPVLEKASMQLVAIETNPVDTHWQDRPVPAQTKMIKFSNESAGKTSLEKRLEIGKKLTEMDADVALVAALDSCCWLLNIRGSDVPCLPVVLGSALLRANGDMTFFTDLNKLPEGIHEHVGSGVDFKDESEFEAALSALSGVTLLADPSAANAWSQLTAQNAGAKLIAGQDPASLPKAQKNAAELAGMQACHIRDGVSVSRFLAWLDAEVAAGRFYDEGQLADKLASLRVDNDFFQDLSFDTISAVGPNAAMCHYNHNNGTPSLMQNNSIYLVDSGAQYLDGTTDVTRTIAIGEVSDEQKKMVTLVLKGHIALDQAKFPQGTHGVQLDALARQFLWQHGFDYDHGTGHGVGHCLSVHEGPQGISKKSNNVELLTGMVLSNEPGYYRADEFGIRLENLIYIRPCAELAGIERDMLEFAPLTMIPFDTRLLDKRLMTEMEINWLNDYHQLVREKLSPLMQGDDLAWLENATRAF